MEYKVLILGSNSALPAYGRHPSSQYLMFGNHTFLLDCGEGTQIQLQRFHARSRKISNIFITHLHGDHFFGLFGLLQSFNLQNRTEELTVFGPKGMKDLIAHVLQLTSNPLQYPCNIYEIQTDSKTLLFEDDTIRAYSFPLKHRIPCNGFLFAEKRPKVSLCSDRLEEYGIPNFYRESIRKGESYLTEEGELLPAEFFYKEKKPPKSYAYCSDTIPFAELRNYLDGVSTLYHEATFLNSEIERAVETMHTTAYQAGETAVSVGVEKLIIGHYSSRYKDLDLLVDEAKAQFPNTVAAVEGKWIHLE